MFIDASESLNRVRLLGSISLPAHRLIGEVIPYSAGAQSECFWLREQLPLYDIAVRGA